MFTPKETCEVLAPAHSPVEDVDHSPSSPNVVWFTWKKKPTKQQVKDEDITTTLDLKVHMMLELTTLHCTDVDFATLVYQLG